MGARIWKLIEQPKTVQEILDMIVRDFAVEPAHAERDLLAILQEMAGEGLVEIKG